MSTEAEVVAALTTVQLASVALSAASLRMWRTPYPVTVAGGDAGALHATVSTCSSPAPT